MSYRSRVIADGAIHYWRLSEQAGTTAFDSVGTLHGAISALGVTLKQPGALTAVPNDAMAFDSGNGGRIFLSGGVVVPTPVTFEAWIKLPSNGGYAAIFSSRSTVGVFFGIGDHVVQCFAPATNVAGAGLIDDNAWHHVAVVLTGTTGTVYRDGVANGTGPLVWNGSTSEGWISYDPDASGLTFNGLLDELAIYPTALSAAQIAAHFTARNELEPTGGAVGIPGWMLGDDGMTFNTWRTITPSNTVDFSRPTDAILVGAAGDIAAVMQNNQVVVLSLPAGAWVPIAARRINATGTTATGLVALNNS